MKKIICFIEIIFLISFLYAQTGGVESNNYYYLNGNPCFWETDSTSIIFLVDTNQLSYAYSRLQMMFPQENDTVMYSEEDDNIIVISSSLLDTNVDSVILFFSTNYGIDIYFWSYAKKISGKRLWLRNEVLSKVKNTEFFPQIIDIINRFNHSTVTIEDSVYLNVCCADDATVIRLANALFESGLVVFSQPDFYYSYENHYNDPLYNLQYYLYNNTNMGGMERFDLKTEYAWNFLRTVTPIDTPIVAIIDDGVEDHEDLVFNGRSKVLNGFPVGNHGRPKIIQVHGQCCAGIVGATQNNGKGISGVAPDSWIVPIRNQKVLWYNGFAYSTSEFMNSGRIARGVRQSWKNYNSDILNNSWGSLDEMSDAIIDAFICANSQGRNMKGCVIVASTGNDGSADAINFIGRIPNVISVGAINKNGNRCHYSNYSPEISVVAFGGDLDENSEADICTIDREGRLGNNNSNYYEKFGGTSAAAPMVSGVASLMLSVNPNLTSQQVKNIIERTAQKLPNYAYSLTPSHINGTWNNQVGYGLVDAHKAVVYAYMFGHETTINAESNPEIYHEYTCACNIYRPDLFTYEWSCKNANISFTTISGQQTTFIPISTGEDSIFVSIYNQNRLMYKIGKKVVINDPCQVSNMNSFGITNFSISSNFTWNGNNNLLTVDASIDPHAILTITGTLHCAPTARIIVRPGGRLIVDGGTLTSACDDGMWEGIFVEGNRTLPQTPANQGVVELRNGATIENARTAIRTASPDYDGTSTGGIVLADDATFRNCRRAVEFLPYADTVSQGIVRDNQSRFNRCTFTVDNDNRFAANQTDFSTHVSMHGVKGVHFKACSFTNTAGGSISRGHAIYTEDAGFSVSGFCEADPYALTEPCECPSDELAATTFSGFATAVETNTTGKQYAVTVDRARFHNNAVGIEINGNGFATVARCDFDLQTAPTHVPGLSGLYLNNCTGYLVEDNQFHRSSYSEGASVSGILVSHSGPDDNAIRRNAFSNLNYGVYAEDVNGSFSRPISGLEISCNDFTGNGSDIYIPADASIRPDQGSATRGADNTFAGSHLYSLYAPPSGYRYFHSSGHAPVSYSNFSIRSGAAANGCESTFCHDSGISMATYQGRSDGQSPDDAFALEMAANASVRGIMSDTLEDLSALADWYGIMDRASAKYALAETQRQLGKDNALTLQYIADKYLVSERDREEYENYLRFEAVKMGDWREATGEQLEELRRIAEKKSGRSSVMARGVLCFFFEECDGELPEFEDGMDTERRNATDMSAGNQLVAYPNPFDDVLSVYSSQLTILRVQLLDVFGKLLLTQSARTYGLDLDLSAYPAGLYLLKAELENGRTEVMKVVKK